MTVGKGYAPLGKSKVIATPDANKNNKPVAVNKDKKRYKSCNWNKSR